MTLFKFAGESLLTHKNFLKRRLMRLHQKLLTSFMFPLPNIATAGVSSGICRYLCNNLRRSCHNSCFLEHKQKKCSISSGTSLHSEHRGLIFWSNLDSLYTQLFNRLYWKIPREDSIVGHLDFRPINFSDA